MEQFYRCKFPPSINPSDFLSELKNLYSLQSEKPIEDQYSYFDTFDWRLFKAGLCLININKTFQLSNFKSEISIGQLTWRRKTFPKFWWDFPEWGQKDRLKSLLDVRALQPLVEFKKQRQLVRILNEDEKTVLKLEIERVEPVKKNLISELPSLLKIQPIRGYRKEAKDFRSFLKKLELEFIPESEFEIIVKSVGLNPGDYSSKLTIQLETDQSSLKSTKIILQNLVQTIKNNEAGIVADIDTEFLHDFRVAIRRTRSAITQLKGVLPTNAKINFKQKFAQLGQLTNKMRDIDVYLLKKVQYQNMLPENLRPGLNILFNSLKRERRVELRKIKDYLNSDSYKTSITEWETFLESLDHSQDQMKNAKKPIYELAKKYILKQYKIVVNNGEKIIDTTPDEELHRLRIECKKLRYLLEFFLSLFPENEISGLIKHFKKLQDNLGDFNDLSVQQNQLDSFLTHLKIKEPNKTQVSISLGGLISALYQKQKFVRNAFHKTFQSFHTKETDKLFLRLFS